MPDTAPASPSERYCRAMQTRGPVVVDSTHTKFFLLRHRPPQFGALIAPDLIRWVDIRRSEAQSSPADIQAHDRLVCDLIRMTGTMYDDVQQHLAAPGDLSFAERGLALVGALTDEAFSHLDVMPDLFLGQQSSPRISALNAGLAHNIAVTLLERGMITEGRETARMGLQVLREGQKPERTELLAESIEPHLTVLAVA